MLALQVALGMDQAAVRRRVWRSRRRSLGLHTPGTTSNRLTRALPDRATMGGTSITESRPKGTLKPPRNTASGPLPSVQATAPLAMRRGLLKRDPRLRRAPGYRVATAGVLCHGGLLSDGRGLTEWMGRGGRVRACVRVKAGCLNHSTTPHRKMWVVRAQGVEPWTTRLKAGCSDLLS